MGSLRDPCQAFSTIFLFVLKVVIGGDMFLRFATFCGLVLVGVGAGSPVPGGQFASSFAALGNAGEQSLRLLVASAMPKGSTSVGTRGFVLIDPHDASVERWIHHGLEPSNSTRAVAAVCGAGKEGEKFDFAYVGGVQSSGQLVGFVVFAQSHSGKEICRIALPDIAETGIGPSICNIGNYDKDPGDEVLVAYPTYANGVRSYDKVVISAWSGKILGALPADAQLVGDVSNDGVRDYVVHKGAGADVFDTKSKRRLFGVNIGAFSASNFDVPLYSMGLDHDGDRVSDILVLNCWYEDDEERQEVVSVVVVSGKSGIVIRKYPRIVCDSGIYASATSIPDQNGDESPDIAIGVWNAWETCESFKLFGLHDEAFAELHWEKEPNDVPGALLGQSVVPVGDLNGDGVAELAISRGSWDRPNIAGAVLLYSAKSGVIRIINQGTCFEETHR